MTTNIYRVLPYYVQGSLPSTLWSSTLIFLTALRGVYQVLFTPHFADEETEALPRITL